MLSILWSNNGRGLSLDILNAVGDRVQCWCIHCILITRNYVLSVPIQLVVILIIALELMDAFSDWKMVLKGRESIVIG